MIHYDTLLQNARDIITKCDSYFIIKCDSYYKLRQFYATVIKKYDVYYKLRQYIPLSCHILPHTALCFRTTFPHFRDSNVNVERIFNWIQETIAFKMVSFVFSIMSFGDKYTFKFFYFT